MFSLLLTACSLTADRPPQQPIDLAQLRIAGVVLDAERRPVPNCEIWLDDAPRSTRSDGSGLFLLTAQRRSFVTVHARAPGRGIGAVWVDGRASARAVTTVPVWPTRALRGTVRAADGSPVVGALVAAAPDDRTDLAIAQMTVRTDANGDYRIEDVVVGPVTVRATKPGVGGAVVSDAAGSERIDLEIDPDECRTLEVLVTACSPQQLAAASVHVFAERDGLCVALPPELAQGRCDRDGRCELVGVPARATLHVEVEVVGAVLSPPRDFMPASARRWTCSFAGSAPSQLRGRLTAAGKPVGGLVVAAVDADAVWKVQRPRTALTLADGTFELDAPVARGGNMELTLLDSDLLLAEAAATDPTVLRIVHDPGVRHEVLLLQADVCTGRLVDAAGRPTAAAEVVWAREDSGSTWTSLEGEFRIVQHPTTDAPMSLFVAEASGGGLWRRATSGTPHTDLGALVAAAPGVLRGRLLDARREPVAGARLTLTGLPEVDLHRLAITASDGSFAFAGLPEARYWVASNVAAPQWDELDLVAGSVVERDIVLR